jgi:hypothetical protein
MSSPKQIDANRRNAQKSTGPRSRPGKDKTRFNGLKHGLRAEHVVLPGESQAEFDAERQAWFADWKPQSHTRAILAERAAVASWRMRRGVRVETARTRNLALEAGRTFDRRVADMIEQAMRQMGRNPNAALDLLRADPAGIDHLLTIVARLDGDLVELGGWTSFQDHYNALMALIGYPVGTGPDEVEDEDDQAVADDALGLLIFHDPSVGDPADGPISRAKARRIAARLREELALLRRDLEAAATRFVPNATTRAWAVDAASQDVSKEGQLIHRYEMAHDRSLRATIGQLMALEKSGADVEDWADDESQDETENEVTSSDSAAPTEANPPEPPITNAPTEANLEAVPAALDKSQRDRDGRTWPVEAADPGGLARSDS